MTAVPPLIVLEPYHDPVIGLKVVGNIVGGLHRS